MQQVVMLPVRRMPRTIHGYSPIHCLLRKVGGRDILGARGAQKDRIGDLRLESP